MKKKHHYIMTCLEEKKNKPIPEKKKKVKKVSQSVYDREAKLEKYKELGLAIVCPACGAVLASIDPPMRMTIMCFHCGVVLKIIHCSDGWKVVRAKRKTRAKY